MQRARAGIHRDPRSRSGVIGEFPLESRYLAAQNVLTAFERPRDSFGDLRLDALVLGFQVYDRDQP